jgi:hypothetical protein
MEGVRKPKAAEDQVDDLQLLHIYFTTTKSTFTTSIPPTQQPAEKQPLLVQVPPFSRATGPSAFFCHSTLLTAALRNITSFEQSNGIPAPQQDPFS